MENKRLQNIFLHMKDRCYNSNNKEFKDYGGRGIFVCEKWYTPHSHRGWKAFRDWALSHGYQDDLTIDRIDVNKEYSPENCRWVTMQIQQNNKRNNRLITYKGKTQTIAQWCSELGFSFSTIKYRLNRNFPPEKIFAKKNLSSERYLNPVERQLASERVKVFMADPEKKAKWKASLLKRNNK